MPIEKDTEAVNVEGILANFFLGKFEMEDSKSDSDSSGRRRKKHKKHKSKKSKSKSKKRSRSRSTERKSKDSFYTGDCSSSEEKDILRLQRLKKLDFKENKHTSVDISTSSEISNYGISAFNADTNSVKECDIPYGPSLETLLSGGSDNVSKENVKGIDVIESSESKVHNNENTKDISTIKENKIETNILSPKECNRNNVEPTFETTSEVSKSCAEDKIMDDDEKKGDLKGKNVTEHSDFISENLSVDEGKHSKEKKQSEKQNSPSQSTAGHKSHKRKNRSYSKSRSRSSSNSRSRKKSRSRSRSRENRKGYKDRSGRRRSRSLSRRRSRSNSYTRNRSRSRYKRYSSRTPLRDKDRYTAHDDFKYSSKYSGRRRRSSSSEYDYKSRQSKRRSRSNSVDRERGSPKSLKIDQEKIRQIAQKNVLNMIEKGTLPEGLSLENFKKEQLVSLKAGGKSVQELTEFCAKLSKRENDPHEEEIDTATNDSSAAEEGFIHHPFKIKETSSIKLNIKNAVQIPIKTHAEKVAETARLSSQFPVSSGNQHRQKELEWIPVEPKVKEQKNSKDIKALVPLNQTSTTIDLHQNKISEEDQQTAASDSLSSDNPSVPSVAVLQDSSIPALLPPPLPPVPPALPSPLPTNNLLSFNTATENVCAPAGAPNDYVLQQSLSYPVATMENNYFSQPETPYLIQPQQTVYPMSTTTNFKSKKPIDVASVITRRFKALTKLQSNPNDAEALQDLEQAQASIQDWVQSQQVPGLFTGSTGAKPLSVEELSGPRHWNYRAKKDIFIRAAPVTEGKGMSLLKKMGWNPGEGLGKNKEGSLEPLVLDIKTDKKGLVSEGEGSKKMVSSVLKDLQGKHPVSALMELCSKRKWKPPLYTLVKESGPPHKKLFLFKVEVNNVEYQSASPVNNKKVAKADAAVICLQALNVFSK